MSTSKKEIEIKAQITNYKDLLSQLNKLRITLSEPLVQRDIIFWPIGTMFEDLISGTPVLRIREENDRVLFTLKIRSKERELSKIEKEITIKNAATLKEMIELLGYNEVLKISKSRRTARYEKYSICIDEVEGLGHFIEIEHLTSEDGDGVPEDMLMLLRNLGIDEEDIVEKGYDTLLLQK